MPPAKPHTIIILVLAIIKFCIPFLLIAPSFELQRDEFLYYQQGQHAALGYLENPPLLSYLARVSSWLGGGEWTIKLWPALIGASTLIITCLIVARLGGMAFAQFLAGLGIITGVFLRIHILFQPNILDIFSWTSSIYFLVRYTRSKNFKDILGMVLCIALGWWSKYSIVFLAAAIFIGLLLTHYRFLLWQGKTYLLAAIGILIILPNLWWQYAHHWPVLHHMKELRETQLAIVNPVNFIIDQLLLLFPVLIIWIAGLIWFFTQSIYRIIGWIYLLVIVLLIAGSGKNYYSVGIYPVLLAGGAVAWEQWSKSKKWIRYVLIISIIGLTIPFLRIGLPLEEPKALSTFYEKKRYGRLGILEWEDHKNHALPQDFADMLGWKELTEKAESFFDKLPDSSRANTIIYCRNYGQAGALQYYGRNEHFRKKVISDNGSFLLWIPDSFLLKNLIFIGRSVPKREDEVFQHFETVRMADSVTNPLSRQLGDKIIFFENADTMASWLANKIIKEKKREFNY